MKRIGGIFVCVGRSLDTEGKIPDFDTENEHKKIARFRELIREMMYCNREEYRWRYLRKHRLCVHTKTLVRGSPLASFE